VKKSPRVETPGLTQLKIEKNTHQNFYAISQAPPAQAAT
jgi:hypothetical protein